MTATTLSLTQAAVARALADLCRAAGVPPESSDPAHGRALAEHVATRYPADPEQSPCPASGPWSRWLRAATGAGYDHQDRRGPRALVTDYRVILRFGVGEGARTECVDLPPVVRLAVQMGERWRLDGAHVPTVRVRAARPARGSKGGRRPAVDVSVVCPTCAVPRVLRIFDEPASLAKARRRPCAACTKAKRERATKGAA